MSEDTRVPVEKPIPVSIIITDMEGVPVDGEEIYLDEAVRTAIRERMKQTSQVDGEAATREFVLEALDQGLSGVNPSIPPSH